MPLTAPRTDEDEKTFVQRCMGDEASVFDFPDEQQRFAVCSRLWVESEKDMKRKFCEFELKEATSDGDVIGYGSVFGNIDEGGDIVEKGAFSSSLERRNPKMLWGHDSYAPAIGVWNEAKEDEHGLLLKGAINLDSAMGIEVHSALKMGAVDGMSIGYMIRESDTDRNGVTSLKELDLFEVSFVNFPMNVEARVDAVKAKIIAGTLSKRELETILRDAGLSKSQAKAIVAVGFTGLKHRDDDNDINDELKSAIRKLSNGTR